MNTLTMLSLLKPTVAFTFDLKRLTALLVFPVSVLTAVTAATYFFPVFSLAETAELR